MNYNDAIDLLKIKKKENDFQLLVADKKTLEWYKNRNLPISSKITLIDMLVREELDLGDHFLLFFVRSIKISKNLF